MKSLYITLFLIINFCCHAQQTPQEKFQNDLANNGVKLYILGGIAARVHPQDAKFQETYKLRYYDFGCLAPVNLDFYRDYNVAVLNYLEEHYGFDYKKDVRKDILGFDKKMGIN